MPKVKSKYNIPENYRKKGATIATEKKWQLFNCQSDLQLCTY